MWPACCPGRDTISTKLPFRKLTPELHPGHCRYGCNRETFPHINSGKEFSGSQEIDRKKVAKRGNMCYIET
jgi:hypothetical protein